MLQPTRSTDPAALQIVALPGWDGKLPSRQYSGFLDGGASRNLHYVFVQASAAEPAKAPVVLWLNGGPGASSFGYGYLTELGPFYVGRCQLCQRARLPFARGGGCLV